MERWSARVAMVTGASKSLGLTMVETLATNGMTVIAVDDDNNDFAKVEEMAQNLKTTGAMGEVMPMKCDLRVHDSIKKLFGVIRSDPDVEGVDVCVHCASITLGESILDGNPDVWRMMLEMNVLAPAIVTQEAFKSMKEKNVNDGHIIYINSMNSHRVVPGNKALHFMAITKHATRALLEGVRNELRLENSQTRVTALSPGVMETDVIHKLFDDDVESAQAFLGEKKYLTAQDVANAVVYVLEQPPHVQVHDILMRATEQVP